MSATSIYAIYVERRAKKEMKRLPDTIFNRIQEKIEALSLRPYPAGCKKMNGYENAWRVRVGDYRIVYAVDDSLKRIDIRAVGHRQYVYEA
jgi:mRNA interferase RelE/StbE